jgi:3-isopropylmalate/(R)-2-methylmalate dehydratase small subunit
MTLERLEGNNNCRAIFDQAGQSSNRQSEIGNKKKARVLSRRGRFCYGLGETPMSLHRARNSISKLYAKIRQMEPFRTHTGKIAVVDADNIDTDRIIPARFLSRVSRSGYGELLFNDVRGDTFPLDQPQAKGASILVVGSNFGCGSSREHAVWAIQQAGFQAVVSRTTPEIPGYSDIFRQNSANCGLLLVELPADQHAALSGAGSGAEATIDLVNQLVSINGQSLKFDINQVTKEALVNGRDLIGTTLVYDDQIAAYEKNADLYVPALAQ